MIELLQFIFRDLNTFLGTVVLIVVFAWACSTVIDSIADAGRRQGGDK